MVVTQKECSGHLWTVPAKSWCHAFKAFLHVSVDPLGILCLTQDLQQVVVGQEEEAREEEALRLQVVVQA